MTRVRDLAAGTKFRSGSKVFVLQKCNECAALVEEESVSRTVKIKDAEFTVSGGRRYHIAPNAEVDEILGTGEVRVRTVTSYVNEFEEARLAIQRQERKERAKAAEEEVA